MALRMTVDCPCRRLVAYLGLDWVEGHLGKGGAYNLWQQVKQRGGYFINGSIAGALTQLCSCHHTSVCERTATRGGTGERERESWPSPVQTADRDQERAEGGRTGPGEGREGRARGGQTVAARAR